MKTLKTVVLLVLLGLVLWQINNTVPGVKIIFRDAINYPFTEFISVQQVVLIYLLVIIIIALATDIKSGVLEAPRY